MVGAATLMAQADGTFTVTGLTPACSYSFSAVVTNALGFTSASSNGTTLLMASLPSPPRVTAAEAGATHATSIRVHFEPQHDGSSNVTAFVVAWSRSSSFDVEAGRTTVDVGGAVWEGASASVEIDGLEEYVAVV